jgi:hypothetical protein
MFIINTFRVRFKMILPKIRLFKPKTIAGLQTELLLKLEAYKKDLQKSVNKMNAIVDDRVAKKTNDNDRFSGVNTATSNEIMKSLTAKMHSDTRTLQIAKEKLDIVNIAIEHIKKNTNNNGVKACLNHLKTNLETLKSPRARSIVRWFIKQLNLLEQTTGAGITTKYIEKYNKLRKQENTATQEVKGDRLRPS